MGIPPLNLVSLAIKPAHALDEPPNSKTTVNYVSSLLYCSAL